MGRVEAICLSKKKGEKKRPVASARFIADRGIEGDAHAGSSHRQVSLLAAEEIEAFKRPDLPDIKDCLTEGRRRFTIFAILIW